MQLLLVVDQERVVSLIGACPWQCEVRLEQLLEQPSRVRQFARAAGILAKTDRIDAAVLCAFGKAMEPQVSVPNDPEQERLREMESHRRHLVHLLVAEQNRSAQLSDTAVLSLNK